jgi:hypothetical protein
VNYSEELDFFSKKRLLLQLIDWFFFKLLVEFAPLGIAN